MKTVSILGSGWLGFPLARHFLTAGYLVKASTTSKKRIADIKTIGADPFIINIDSLTDNVQEFLQANILIINIPSKNIAGFRLLADEIEASACDNVLFVSSTSVYQNIKKTVAESDTKYLSQSPLLDIERLLKRCRGIETTIVRFGGLIGYSRHPGRFFGPERIVQNPDSPVNLIHRDDCVEIISKIIEQQFWGEVFNCSADTHPTKREFYTRAIESVGGILPEFGETDQKTGKIISNDKVKQLLNYEFKHPDIMRIVFGDGT